MKYFVIFIFISVFSLSEVYAQAATYTIGVNSTIISPLAFGTNRNLEFGNINKNSSKHILPSDINSGRWEITGQANKNVQIGFILTSTLASGGNSLTLSYDGSDAGWTENGDGSSQTNFAPNQNTIANLGAMGKIYVHIGGLINCPSNQTAGNYSGSITISVQYTGN